MRTLVRDSLAEAPSPPTYALTRFRIEFADALEGLVKTAGRILGLLGKDPEGVEMVLRGKLLGGNGLRVGRNVRFVGRSGSIRFGRNVSLFGNTYVNANGEHGSVLVGEESHVDQFCVLYGQGGLSLGPRCAIAAGSLIYSQTNADTTRDGTPVVQQPILYKEVIIGEGCWLGAGVRVLPGVVLGDGACVGAGAVVTHSLPARCLAVGVPAKVVRRR